MSEKSPQESRRGPKPDRVKIEGDWEDAIDKALEKKRPNEGWPKDDSSQDVKDEESDK